MASKLSLSPISDLPNSIKTFPKHPQAIRLSPLLPLNSRSSHYFFKTKAPYTQSFSVSNAVTDQFVESSTSKSTQDSQTNPSIPSSSTSPSSNKVVLVVGATGGVGQLVVASLLDRNIKSHLLIRKPEKATALFGEHSEDKLKVFKGDTRNTEDLNPSVFEVSSTSISATAGDPIKLVSEHSILGRMSTKFSKEIGKSRRQEEKQPLWPWGITSDEETQLEDRVGKLEARISEFEAGKSELKKAMSIMMEKFDWMMRKMDGQERDRNEEMAEEGRVSVNWPNQEKKSVAEPERGRKEGKVTENIPVATQRPEPPTMASPPFRLLTSATLQSKGKRLHGAHSVGGLLGRETIFDLHQFSNETKIALEAWQPRRWENVESSLWVILEEETGSNSINRLKLMVGLKSVLGSILELAQRIEDYNEYLKQTQKAEEINEFMDQAQTNYNKYSPNWNQILGIPSKGPTGYGICQGNILIVCGQLLIACGLKNFILTSTMTGIRAKEIIQLILKSSHTSTLRTRWIFGRRVMIGPKLSIHAR